SSLSLHCHIPVRPCPPPQRINPDTPPRRGVVVPVLVIHQPRLRVEALARVADGIADRAGVQLVARWGEGRGTWGSQTLGGECRHGPRVRVGCTGWGRLVCSGSDVKRVGLGAPGCGRRSEEHTYELQSRENL